MRTAAPAGRASAGTCRAAGTTRWRVGAHVLAALVGVEEQLHGQRAGAARARTAPADAFSPGMPTSAKLLPCSSSVLLGVVHHRDDARRSWMLTIDALASLPGSASSRPARSRCGSDAERSAVERHGASCAESRRPRSWAARSAARWPTAGCDRRGASAPARPARERAAAPRPAARAAARSRSHAAAAVPRPPARGLLVRPGRRAVERRPRTQSRLRAAPRRRGRLVRSSAKPACLVDGAKRAR